MAVVPEFKLIAMADGCFASLPAPFSYRTLSHHILPLRTKAVSFRRLSCSASSLSLPTFIFTLSKRKVPLTVSLVALTSDWARQDEEGGSVEAGFDEENLDWSNEDDELGLSEGEGAEAVLSEWEGEDEAHEDGGEEVASEGGSVEASFDKEDLDSSNEDNEFGLSEGKGAEGGLSEWEWEGEDQAHEDGVEEVVSERGSVEASLDIEDLDWSNEDDELGRSEAEGAEAGLSKWEGEDQAHEDGVEEAVSEGDDPVNKEFDGDEGEEPYLEPPEDAKVFVGNLPYDVDSEMLAHLFENAGVVEIAEVVYDRTDQSRGFGFVTMSTVEEAEKAVEMFHHYDHSGRFLTVNKAVPRGSIPERQLKPFPRMFVGNLSWDVDDARLGQVFGEHGKVVNARVVYDNETGRSRGFGFVTMTSKSEADDAIAALDGQSLDGRSIRVSIAERAQR